MTTIAYRDGVLAADTSAWVGDSSVGVVKKITQNSQGDLAAAAGNACWARSFLKWFEAGEIGEAPKPECDPQANSLDRGIIIRRSSRQIEILEDRGVYTIEADYIAIGAGRAEALGAMFAGADAETAIKAAAAHDAHTSGDVCVLRLDAVVLGNRGPGRGPSLLSARN